MSNIVDIYIHKINESLIKIQSGASIIKELSEHLTFDVPGAKFMPSFKSRVWDGKIRLLNSKNNTTYAGLYTNIEDFAKEHDYSCTIDDKLSECDEISNIEAVEFIKSLNLPVVPHEHQLRAFIHAIRNKRSVLISPTASGKSLIAYLITRWYNKKILIVVPTISLVTQLISDFKSYGYDEYVHGVTAGVEKETSAMITVSTWQSMFNMDEEFFSDFDVVIGDEAHLFKAKSLIGIMSKMTNTQYRFGMTGTLDGAQVHTLVLEGLFGKVEKIIQTSDLIESGKLSPLKIKIIILKHETHPIRDKSYQEELDYIISNEARNKFIRNLALSLRGNTLVLYSFVEKHGEVLYQMIKDKTDRVDIHFVSGSVHAADREEIRINTETTTNGIIVASFGTFSTGINIRNLHNIIFASPTKSRIRTLQSIGRGLRLGDNKTHCKLFDIADDLTVKGENNFTLNHLIERVKMYNEESFPYELFNIKLNNTNE